MAVRKYILTVIFIVLLAVSYLYIMNQYNIKVVEYSFTGQINRADIEELGRSTKSIADKSTTSKGIPFIINYVGQYNECRLVMSSGLDPLVKAESMLKGRWIAAGEVREAVLGDRAADMFFRNSNVIGQTIKLYGQEYRIVGVIKSSNDIYISFDEKNRATWSKKNIKFIIEDDRRLYLYTELLEGKLKGLGLDIIDVNSYKQEAYWYMNITLAIAIFHLFGFAKKQWLQIQKSIRLIYLDFMAQVRVIELHKYIYRNRKDIAIVFPKLLLLMMFLLAILKCISLLHIPPNLIPSNLFSPSSYIEVIKVNIKNYLNRLENGISGILLEVHVINFLMLVYVAIALYLNNNPSVNKD